MEQPGKEKLGVRMVAMKDLIFPAREFGPGCLNGIPAVTFPDQPYDASGVPVNDAVQPVPQPDRVPPSGSR